QGWKLDRPKGTMFVWAEIPGPYKDLGSIDFSMMMLEEAGVAVSPGVGFGPSGEGHVRFALVEDADRIGEAVDRMGGALELL
ncbi:MAG: alanine transaminase, partial [Acidimicrobiia bacterium]